MKATLRLFLGGERKVETGAINQRSHTWRSGSTLPSLHTVSANCARVRGVARPAVDPTLFAEQPVSVAGQVVLVAIISVKQLPALTQTVAHFQRLPFNVFMPIENDLDTKGRVSAHANRHMAPRSVQDMKK